jgi:hypothetical protein
MRSKAVIAVGSSDLRIARTTAGSSRRTGSKRWRADQVERCGPASGGVSWDGAIRPSPAPPRGASSAVPRRLPTPNRDRRTQENAEGNYRKLNKEINAGLADPKIKARLAAPLPGTPAEFGKLIADISNGPPSPVAPRSARRRWNGHFHKRFQHWQRLSGNVSGHRVRGLSLARSPRLDTRCTLPLWRGGRQWAG